MQYLKSTCSSEFYDSSKIAAIRRHQQISWRALSFRFAW